MTLKYSLHSSHRYSHPKMPIVVGFKLSIEPGKLVTARRIHYVLLIDVSSSMCGGGGASKQYNKLELAREGALGLLRSLPEGNYVTLIGFGFYDAKYGVRVLGSGLVEQVRPVIENALRSLECEDGTPLYSALRIGYQKAAELGVPGYLILISDGQPTDIKDVDEYLSLTEGEMPDSFRPILVGVGPDYNVDLFTRLCNATRCIFHHVGASSDLDRLPEIIRSAAKTTISARDLRIHVKARVGELKIAGFDGPTITYPAVGERVEVRGLVEGVPPGYSGDVLEVGLEYIDPLTDSRVSDELSIGVEAAGSGEEYLKGVDKGVLSESIHAIYIDLARRLVEEERVEEAAEAFETAAKALEAASQVEGAGEEETRRIELVEETRRLADLVKRGGDEETRRIVLSELTRRIRGG